MSGVLSGRRRNPVRIEIVTEKNDPPARQVLTDDRDLIAFAGADATADRLTALPARPHAQIIKAVPDRAQLPSIPAQWP
jgi:hypothetical protein